MVEEVILLQAVRLLVVIMVRVDMIIEHEVDKFDMRL